MNNNNFEEINTRKHTCYYFDDKVLLNKTSYKNILIHDCKTPGAKLFHIFFDEVDGYVRKHDGTKCLTLFRSDEKYENIFGRIGYLIMLKSNISGAYSCKYIKININLDEDLSLAKNGICIR